jgi:23S rRNA (guanine745-N1)-methyltransferase
MCGAGLTPAVASLRCASGHSFDVARQGYVNLLTGNAPAGLGDSVEMVDARSAFLEAGHFDPLVRGVAEMAADATRGVAGAVVDVGAGTGRYPAATLDLLPGRAGLALDGSRFAARRAARAHPRMGAVVCDAWRRLPIRDGVAAVVLDVFAPRNGAETARTLATGGSLIVATPTARHLEELVDPLRLLTVDELKQERLRAELAPHLHRDGASLVEQEMMLDRGAVAHLVAMGPSARHTDPAELERAIAGLGDPAAVTLSVTVSRWRRG